MKTNDEMMAELLAQAETYLDGLAGKAGKGGFVAFQNEMRRYVYMIEAFQANQNLLLAKLSYDGDLDDVPHDELIRRFLAANLFAGKWMLARIAA